MSALAQGNPSTGVSREAAELVSVHRALTREWQTVAEIASAALGDDKASHRKRAARSLDSLAVMRRAESTVRGDGASLWRRRGLAR